MAVVTGAKRAHVDALRARTDFFHLFDFVVAREDVTKTKPSPEPYLQAVRRAGARVEDCVAIADSERGLRSAKAAGLECWIIPNRLTAGSRFSAADRILNDVREVRTLLNGGGPP
jgi:HAD superfamily hydrolase (TIGR01509 family)